MLRALELIESSRTDGEGIAILNPANGEHVATVCAWELNEIVGAIDRADRVRPAWSMRTAKERSKVLKRWHDLIMASQVDLAEIVTAESGKPMEEAMSEVAYGAAYVEWFAEEGKRAYGEVIPTFAEDTRVLTLRHPVGTCAAITPWNFPVAMVTRKVAPALAAGCSMILKPAEATPLSALVLEELAVRAGVPGDLFRVVPTTDPAAVGRLFCSDDRIRKLSFTGSTGVGKILMSQAADQVMRLSLELGGNAPFIVMDDADLEKAVRGLLDAKFRNGGQTCICANRILVHDAVYEAFAERLCEAVRNLTVGAGSTAGVRIGPLIDARAAQRVNALIANALASGARVLANTPLPPDAGDAFVSPTVLSDVHPGMEIANTEIFGPVAPLIRFADEAEAISLANDTPYGLAAYLYCSSLSRGWRMMEALDYGMVAVNDSRLSSEVVPFGGVKQSGFGREGGSHGLAEYMEIKYALFGIENC